MAIKKSAPEPTYKLPKDVADWIEEASSRIRHLTEKSNRLDAENKALKKSIRLMEQRVMRQSHE
jgi:hypothetical protein